MTHEVISPGSTASDEPVVHNSVLIRSHETRRENAQHWLMIAPLLVALAVGAAVLVYVRSAPQPPPVVNHAMSGTPWTGN